MGSADCGVAAAAKVYEAPTLTVRGSVAALTGAQHAGMTTDKAFPAGTAISQLSFS